MKVFLRVSAVAILLFGSESFSQVEGVPEPFSLDEEVSSLQFEDDEDLETTGYGGFNLLTKFVCCEVHSTSSIGSGGGTSYKKVFSSKAPTKRHAMAQCTIYKMFWNTRNCPKSSEALENIVWSRNGGGFFTQTSGKSWVEHTIDGKTWKFQEYHRVPAQDLVYLYDSSRNTVVVLGKKEAHAQFNMGPMTFLFKGKWTR